MKEQESRALGSNFANSSAGDDSLAHYLPLALSLLSLTPLVSHPHITILLGSPCSDAILLDLTKVL